MTYQEAYQEILQMEEEIKLLANRQKQEEDILAVKKAQAEEQKSSYYKELTDVEKLEKMTLTKLFAKISGSYEEKHEKEYQEYITAKRRRDEWNYEIEEQKNLISRYRNDITRMTAECRAKKRQLRENYPEGQALAAEEEEKRRELLRKRRSFLRQ